MMDGIDGWLVVDMLSSAVRGWELDGEETLRRRGRGFLASCLSSLDLQKELLLILQYTCCDSITAVTSCFSLSEIW